jgi:hypothetical protein
MDQANHQVDWQELSAFMDGELSAERAGEIARLLASDGGWAEAYRQLQAVHASLDLLRPEPMRADLTDRIVRAAGRRSRTLFVIRLAGAAAAACLVAAAVLAFLHRPTPPAPTAGGPTAVEVKIANILKDVPPEDQFIVQNLPLFKDYEQVGQYEKLSGLADAQTLNALAELEKAGDL